MERGRFITFEGGEGAGKTTQVRMLAEALQRAGIDVLTTREPGGSQGAERIRRLLVEGDVAQWDPVTEALLHFAARRDHVARVVWPALDAGRWVISDRFTDSTMAYQGHGQGVGRSFVERLHGMVLNGFSPDLTIILDLAVEVGLHRASQRPGVEDRYERMGLDFHRRLRDAFLDIARREPGRCAVVAADPGVAQVHDAVLEAVAGKLGVSCPNAHSGG